MARKECERRDDDIMATNNSSIVSKRSVERLYEPQEGFFRHFVKKPHIRSPLINRGYWLRMKAIDHVVRKFLEEPSEKHKIVINLGCGYDPLPWQCLSRYPEACKNVTFVDIDYPLLLEKKGKTVLATPELNSMLTNLTSAAKNDGVLLQSDQYVQVACDLRDIPTCSRILGSLFNFEDSLVLFTAEVSITYMRLPFADKVIKWAGTFPNAQFCLLEQILPDGPHHPFAKTMLAHFKKLKTPLQSVELYPTVVSQESRFRERGWPVAKACNLWELWSTESFLTSEQRMSLDEIEPFDEWEEFALFGEHYFLLVASNTSKPSKMSFESSSVVPSNGASHLKMTYSENPRGQGCRRFGATLLLDANISHPDAVANHAGVGLNTRLSSIDVYSPSGVKGITQQSPPKCPSPRMCHAITDLGGMALISGGRTSPDHALSDCWLYHKKDGSFERIQDLPEGRFRHTTVGIGNDRVLLIGGKSDSRTIVESCLIWSRYRGWIEIAQLGTMFSGTTERYVCDGDIPEATFGATIASSSSGTGFLIGGISKNCTVSQDRWLWKVKHDQEKDALFIAFQRAERPAGVSYLARFGASVVTQLNRVYLIGGVAASLLTVETEVVALSIETSSTKPSFEACPLRLDDDVPRPLLIGTSAASVDNTILIMGGGATCFSMGTYLNRGYYSLMNTTPAPELPRNWRLLENITAEKASNSVPNTSISNDEIKVAVPRIRVTDTQDFERAMREAIPIILEGLDLGSCTDLWTPEYLKDRVGNDRLVIVHEATTSRMDFQTKNFRYSPMPFGQFMDAAEKGENLYLRALSEESPSELPTDLARDFPSISSDFRLPPELRFVSTNAHSSPLRISGDVAMWLHYDVMANVLCQIRGIKRVLLYPPSDIQYLQFAPGASSSSLDVLSQPVVVPGTHPHEATLNPGDILFIPALWLHATSSHKTGSSISVNVFFRNLQTGYAAGRDVYGNRDLAAYEKGRLDVVKIAKSFDKIPPDMREFYLLRLADELKGKATSGT